MQRILNDYFADDFDRARKDKTFLIAKLRECQNLIDDQHFCQYHFDLYRKYLRIMAYATTYGLPNKSLDIGNIRIKFTDYSRGSRWWFSWGVYLDDRLIFFKGERGVNTTYQFEEEYFTTEQFIQVFEAVDKIKQ